MKSWRSRVQPLLPIAWMLLFLPNLYAQAPPPPTLDEIIQRLENNIQTYQTKVPTFFCNEHVVSKIDPSQTLRDTVTDSIFRLKRTQNPDNTSTLVESREIKTINSRPATSEVIGGPIVISGAFSGAIALVSPEQQECMRYKLLPRHRADKPYVVEFTSTFDRRHPAHCVLQEHGDGRVLIDPATMQIKRMELTAPEHTMEFPKDQNGYAPPSVTGVWSVAVDYAPVLLGSQTFWVPSTIASTMSVAGPHSTNWVYNARYTNYHKLEVTSRIVPAP